MNDIDLLEQRAIDSAISLDWSEAIISNKKIIKLDKKNLHALLRIGYAYLQTGALEDSKKSYKQAIKIQSENQIARENLERITILQLKGAKKTGKKDIHFDPNLFLELPGKTKSVALVNIGQKNVLAHIIIGERIYLKTKKRKIELRTKSGEYVGTFPDDLSKRLFLFIKAGSEYSTFIKDISLSRAVVFIREDKKGKKVMRYASFPKTSQIITTPNSEEDHEGTPATTTEEGEEDNVLENDLEKLAETLHEEKEYFHFGQEAEDEENLEE